jgi:hypothetical protein
LTLKEKEAHLSLLHYPQLQVYLNDESYSLL